MSVASLPFELIETGCSDLCLLRPRAFEDRRGVFVKTFHVEAFRLLGIPFEPREEFYTVSRKGVLRGMHFQLPPAAHAKLVFCPAGSVLDVAVDLRRESQTFGRTFSRTLSAANREILFIPVGFAHGFVALEDNSLMVYKTDSVHDPANDAGIAWNSIGYSWPVSNPVLSDRDLGFPALRNFQTPF